MSNGGSSEVRKKDPSEVTAEDIYTALTEIRAQAKTILELAVTTNEKLINNPVDHPDKEPVNKVDPPKNPRHFPGFKEALREISGILQEAQRLQGFLNKHI